MQCQNSGLIGTLDFGPRKRLSHGLVIRVSEVLQEIAPDRDAGSVKQRKKELNLIYCLVDPGVVLAT